MSAPIPFEVSHAFGLDPNGELRDDVSANSGWYHSRSHGDELPLRYPTLVDALRGAARGSQGITLLADDADDPAQFRSYAELYRAASCVAERLRQRGVGANDHVLLVLPTSFDFIISFFAAQMLGAVPIPSYPPQAMERVELALGRTTAIARKARVRLLITNAQLLPLHSGFAPLAQSVPEQVAFSSLSEGASCSTMWSAEPAREHHAQLKAPAFVQFTSGSTGNPKGVVLTNENLLSNIHAMATVASASDKDTFVSWLPLYHDMGLIGQLLQAVYVGAHMVLMSPLAFLMRPARWLHAISHYRGTITAAPNFAYALCVRRVRLSERSGLDLSSLRLAGNGAEPIALRTLVDFQRAYAVFGLNEAAMCPLYGLAESTVGVTHAPCDSVFKWKKIDRAALARGEVVSAKGEAATSVVCVGVPIPGHRVRIVDANGNDVDERRIGEVIVQGASVMKGYLYDQDATVQSVKDGWLYTGDLGFMSGGGLYITGRRKDLLIVRGRNFAPEDIENVIEANAGIKGGGCFVFALSPTEEADERIVAVCETRGAPDLQALAVRVNESVQDVFGIKLHRIEWVKSGTLPKTSSGKKQRSYCKQLYEANELRSSRTRAITAARISLQGYARMLWLSLRSVGRRRVAT